MVNGIGGKYYSENDVLQIQCFNNNTKIKTIHIRDENITAYQENNYYFYLV